MEDGSEEPAGAPSPPPIPKLKWSSVRVPAQVMRSQEPFRNLRMSYMLVMSVV